MSMASRARGGVRRRWLRSCCRAASTSKARGVAATKTCMVDNRFHDLGKGQKCLEDYAVMDR